MPIQSLAWEGPLEPLQIARQLEAMLFGGTPAPLSPDAWRAEIVRAALWELSLSRRAETLLDSAVTTQQILGRARTLWAPLEGAFWASVSDHQEGEGMQEEEIEHDEVSRALLDVLVEQGDILSLGQGRWIPAPLRLVPLSSTLYLLIGGAPTALFPEPVLRGLRFHGTFRQMEGTVIETVSGPYQDEAWQFQTQENWLGAEPPTLPTLVEQFSLQDLVAVQRNDASLLEAYVASFDEPQGLRWRAVAQVPDGRYLLRNSSSWGQGRYSIGEIGGHALLKQGQVPRSIELRRLLYALGVAVGTPARAAWEVQSNTLVLFSELPARERKKLATLGVLQEKKGQPYYPRRWRIDPRQKGEVWALLTGLGVRMQTENAEHLLERNGPGDE